MQNSFSHIMSEFWMTIIEKLHNAPDKYEIMPEVLGEVCRYFDLGCGFILTADYQGIFSLQASYQANPYYKFINETIPLQEKLGRERYRELLDLKYVAFDKNHDKTPLEADLGRLFHADAMILVPIRAGEITRPAFVGMIDRRGKSRNHDQNIEFAYFIIAVIADYVNTALFRQKSDGKMTTLTRVLDNTGVDVFVIDFHTEEILYANQSMARQYGGESQLLGRPYWKVLLGKEQSFDFYPRDKVVDADNRPSSPYIWNFYNERDHSWKRMITSAFYWIDGRLAVSMSSVDITEAVHNEETIRHYAEYDGLTGLLSRHKLLLDCDDGIERLKAAGQEGFLIFCDLDKFKAVNDTYGHQVGDELLFTIGQYLLKEESIRNNVYRYGGDEFVFLCLEDTREQVEKTIEYLKQGFETPWKLSVGDVYCGASFGITAYPHDALTTSDLLHSADMAMYKAKKKQ